METGSMITDSTRSLGLRLTSFVLAAVSAGVLLGQPASARDGVGGCTIAEVETDKGQVWRYTIDLQVPEGGYCRVYIVEDKDRKSFNYCWLKRTADNPVSATCDDPIDDKDFDVWRAKGVCGDQNSY